VHSWSALWGHQGSKYVGGAAVMVVQCACVAIAGVAGLVFAQVEPEFLIAQPERLELFARLRLPQIPPVDEC
jgi:hypothetical protein